MLGQPAIGRDLAADDRQRRRSAGRRVEAQRVVARDGGRIGATVIVERPHPGVAPADRRGVDRAREIAARRAAQVAHFFIAYLRRLRRRHRDVSGADERELLLERDDEHHAAIVVLQDEGMIAFIKARHDDMAALHQPHGVAAWLAEPLV